MPVLLNDNKENKIMGAATDELIEPALFSLLLVVII